MNGKFSAFVFSTLSLYTLSGTNALSNKLLPILSFVLFYIMHRVPAGQVYLEPKM